MKSVLFALAAMVALVGCKSSYTWRSSVPKDMRYVFVPTFRNESEVTELGAVATREILREIQREGTFKIARPDDAVLEIQGTIKRSHSSYDVGDRRKGGRFYSSTMIVRAEVSIVDRRNGKVLVDNRIYTATGTFVTSQDMMTGMRNASGRASEDLARQIVDDLHGMKW